MQKDAEKRFAQHGPALEMDEIARRAGVGVGTIYRHFATKEALLRALIAGPVSALTREALQLVDSAAPDVALFQFLARVVEHYATKRHLVKVLGRSGYAFAAADPVIRLECGQERDDDRAFRTCYASGAEGRILHFRSPRTLVSIRATK